MDFSYDDLFLQIFSMSANLDHVRDYTGDEEDIFAVWDIENNELVNDYNALKNQTRLHGLYQTLHIFVF